MGCSVITGNDSVATIVVPSGTSNFHPSDFGITNSSFPNAILSPCIDGIGMWDSTVERMSLNCSPGIIIGSGGGSYYNRFYQNAVSQVIYLSSYSNSDMWDGNRQSGSGQGVAFIDQGAHNTYSHTDIELSSAAFWLQGYSIGIHDPYNEGNGSVWSQVRTWAANTAYAYGAGVTDGANHLYICYTNNLNPGGVVNWTTATCGTSGSSTPTWNTTVGQVTTDGSISWLNVTGSDVIFDTNTHNDLVNGVGNTIPLYVTTDNVTNVVDVQGGEGGANYGSFSRAFYAPQNGICFGGDKSCGYNSPGRLDDFNRGGLFTPGFFLGSASNILTQSRGFNGLYLGGLWDMGSLTQYGDQYWYALPQPPAPTVTVVGTPGSAAVNYYVVAHCGNQESIPSPATSVNPPNTFDLERLRDHLASSTHNLVHLQPAME